MRARKRKSCDKKEGQTLNEQANCRWKFRKLQFLKGKRIENLIPLFITMMIIFAFVTYIHPSAGQTFTLEEVTAAPEDTWRMLYVPKADALFVATYHGTVHRFDGENWQLVLDTGRNCYSFLNYDSYGNIYVSVFGRLYKSNDNGNTWSIVFEYSKESFQIWHIADLGNGTLLGDNWVYNCPYLWRSDDSGETWYLWKNFTELFPQYAKPSQQFPGAYLLRHLHLVAYDNYTGKIIVSTGDDIKHLFITSDGETWEVVETGGHTGIMIFEDRILYGPDHKDGLIVYDKSTDTYRVVYKKFGDSLHNVRIDNFVYDDKTGIIYAGIIALPNDNYGIISSSDRGETWNTIYHGGKATEDTFFVFLSIFRRQLYVSMGYLYHGKLYRTPLTNGPTTNKTKTSLTATFSSKVVNQGQKITVSGNLLGEYSPSYHLVGAIEGAPITLSTDWGVEQNTVTSIGGSYSFSVNAPTTDGTYSVKIFFEGDTYFAPCQTTTTLSVLSTVQNLVLNPSFEDDSDLNGVPDYWNGYKSSGVQATLSWVSEPHSGSKSVRVDLTYNPAVGTNAMAWWVQLVDTGFVVGNTYKLRVWYRSSIETKLFIRSHGETAGSWHYVSGKSIWLSPSESWRQAELTYTVAEGTDQLRLGCYFFNIGDGWVLWDDFELVEA